MKPRDAARSALKTLGLVSLSLALWFVLFHFLFQPFQVSGLSMSPTLKDRDHLLVDRLLFREGGLERGDLVVFQYTQDGPFLVKRVVGLPGDTVAIRGGKLLVKGAAASFEMPMAPPPADYGPFLVPREGYFCLGDNGAVSLDSRNFGPVMRSEIYGRAFFRYLPIRESGFLPGKPGATAAGRSVAGVDR